MIFRFLPDRKPFMSAMPSLASAAGLSLAFLTGANSNNEGHWDGITDRPLSYRPQLPRLFSDSMRYWLELTSSRFTLCQSYVAFMRACGICSGEFRSMRQNLNSISKLATVDPAQAKYPQSTTLPKAKRSPQVKQ